MLRFSRILSLLLVCSLAGVVQAKAVKIKVFAPVLLGETETPDVDGMAVFNHDSGQGTASGGVTHIALTFSDLLPSTEYKVQVRAVFGGVTASFTTNPAGVGHVSTEYAGFDLTVDFNGNPADIHVYVFNDEDGDFNVAPDEIRGIGCVSGACTLPASFIPCTQDSECDLPQFPCLNTSCVLDYCKSVWRDCPDDGDVCTLDMCNPTSGVCENTPIYDPDNGCNPF